MDQFLEDEEVARLLESREGWRTNGWMSLEIISKHYRFDSFSQAVQFVNGISGELKGYETHLTILISGRKLKRLINDVGQFENGVSIQLTSQVGNNIGVTQKDIELAHMIEHVRANIT